MEDRNNIISSTDTRSGGSVQRIMKTLKITRRQIIRREQIHRETLAVPTGMCTTLITAKIDSAGTVHRHVLWLAARRWGWR